MPLFVILEHMANGLLVGSYYVVLALGLSLIFSLGGVVNLAHGAFYALGAYLAWEVQRRLGFFGALALSPLGVAAIGVVIERPALRRFYREAPGLALLFPFGLAMAAEQSLRLIWGATGLPFGIPEALRGQIFLGDFIYSRYRLAVRAVSAGGVLGGWLLLNKTPFGLIVRAGTRDPEMVRALGIALSPILTAVFALGVGLAGLAGGGSAPPAGGAGRGPAGPALRHAGHRDDRRRRHRDRDLRPRRPGLQPPAGLHGARLLRPRRPLRARRLRRGAAPDRHPPRPRAGAHRLRHALRRRPRAADRLPRAAAARGLLLAAHPGVHGHDLLHRVPVDRLHRRRERPARDDPRVAAGGPAAPRAR